MDTLEWHRGLLPFAVAVLLLAGVSSMYVDASTETVIRSTQTENRLGTLMTDADRERIDDAFAGGPGRHTVRWSNSDRDIDYTMILAPVFKTARGPCREFEIEAKADDRRTRASGTACEKQGGWRIVE
ncbi:hypothetical protein [Hydrocarboniphaga effusa]|uniref:Surface antigen domain-containing protein n=1 Tax=Hydrocarboniphaga effusa AP103 TaxID=1172194 RepID=I8T3V8_9GAMM|nr:hypothetical protein [Hydrocarboniphaga effusa]EIT68595.1 hypothetical protein WQQ_37900 [Hydrocarboniphaga effusa AP103]